MAREYGRRISGLLYTLMEGSPTSRAKRPSWHTSYWDYWSELSTVILGGGLLAGPFGRIAVDTAQMHLGDRVGLKIPAFPRYLPLIGAAVQKTGDTLPRIVLDGGNTTIKRGVATYLDGKLNHISLQPGVPSPHVPPSRALLDGLVSAAFECWQSHLQLAPFSDTIVASIASYVDSQGHPADWGYYASLYELGPDIPKLVSEAATVTLGSKVNVKMVHDCTVAAASFAGLEKTVVMVFGTAMGRGAPPKDRGAVLEVSESFSISQV